MPEHNPPRHNQQQTSHYSNGSNSKRNHGMTLLLHHDIGYVWQLQRQNACTVHKVSGTCPHKLPLPNEGSGPNVTIVP